MPRHALALLALAAIAIPAAAQPDAPSPRRVLAATDEAFGEATALSFRIKVEHVGATALDQPSLDATVRAVRAGPVWKFVIEGESTAPDGVTRAPLAVWTDGTSTRALDAAANAVYEAAGEAGPVLMGERGVVPAVSWFVLWDGLISQQLEDGGSDLPMKAAGPRLVDGVECQAVRVDYTRMRREVGNVYDVWWFIDPSTNLPVRIEACYFRSDQNAYGFTILSISDLAINPGLSDADLTPALPEGVETRPYALPALDQDVDMAGPAVGTLAPDWTLVDSTGQTRSLSDYRGGVVVMDYWATWCGWCIRAMPGLQRLHEKYQDQPVHILGLNMAEAGDPVAFMKAQGFTYPLLLEADDVASRYEVGPLPTLFAVGPDGRVIFRTVGYSEDLEERLAEAIERALPQARAMQEEGDEADPAEPGGGGQ